MTASLSEMSEKELWRLFPIMLSAPKSGWADAFIKESQRLTQICGPYLMNIYHIGSTAIGGIMTKPTVDMLMEIKKSTDLEVLIKNIVEAGYIYSPQPGKLPPHMMFMKGYTLQGFADEVFHLHVRYGGQAHKELIFRDYLIKNPDAAQEYEKLKQTLAEKFKYDRDAYTEGKTEFIENILKRAEKKT